MSGYRMTMLGTGLIGTFYTQTVQQGRGRDEVRNVFSRSEKRAKEFAAQWNIPKHTTDLAEAINDPETDVVVIGLPNDRHVEAVDLSVKAGKPVLCTKPLGRNAAEAKQMLDRVEQAGIPHGYLEDLAYPSKTLRSLQSIRGGALGEIMWVRSRETHPGPHSAWFWDLQQAGGGVLLDMGCHCIEIGRNFIGKEHKPVEAICWTDTLFHPIEAEDNAVGLVRYANGAVGQFEVSWAFRGGMDLRDEVQGTEGTIWLNHFLRTGYEMFTTGGGDYVAEKAETERGWLFPVGDECHELGYPQMFDDIFGAVDRGTTPMESFYDGYVVNAIMDACYRSARSKQWEPIELEDWRGTDPSEDKRAAAQHEIDGHIVIKKERLPDGQVKLILKNKQTGELSERVESE